MTQPLAQRRIAPVASLVVCVNCTSKQLQRATRTVFRDVHRGEQELSGSTDLWTYPNLHKIANRNMGLLPLAIFVMTSAERLEQRSAIRETWGKESNYPNGTVRIVFFMNMVAGANALKQVQNEAKAYNDVVVQPVGSSASLSSLVTEFVPTRAWGASLVLVLRRDDCFVNVNALLANARRLTNGSFDVAGRRATTTSARNLGGGTVGDIKDVRSVDAAQHGGQAGHDAPGDDDWNERRDTNGRDVRDHGVALLDPCAVLVRGCRVFERLQPVWCLHCGSASSADDMFFSGRLAYAANATLAHLDAFAPCDGGRWSSSKSSAVRRNDSVTINGLSPAEMRAVHKESMQLVSADKRQGRNETVLDARWEKALTPQRLN